MFARKSAALLLSFAFAAASASAAAVSLGALTVESRPGEPLNAVLEIDDVDLSVSPLLVRVAPPSTYERQGVAWPEEVEGLRIAKDSAKNGIRVRVLGKERIEGSFPLLIELNAGGVVTVREYAISAQNGAYVVSPTGERTALKPAVPSVAHPGYALPEKSAQPAAEEKAAEEGAAAPQAASQKPQTKKVRRGRYAPQVVKEYVALNGFSAEEPFHVQRDMTLWSIAKLYWPSYQGATLEQLASAFTAGNPSAFENGDASRLKPGATLAPPSLETVLAVDAEAAFREMHGAAAEIPAPTKNLIEAQRVSLECAEAVANAQNAARAKGASVSTVGSAGANALASCAAPALASGASAAAPDKPASQTDAALPSQAPAEGETAVAAAAAAPAASASGAAAPADGTAKPESAQPSAPRAPIAIPSEEELRPKIEVSATAQMPNEAADAPTSSQAERAAAPQPDGTASSAESAPAAPATPSAEPAPSGDSTAAGKASDDAASQAAETTKTDEQVAKDSGLSMPWLALIVIVAAILAGLAWTRSRRDESDGCAERSPEAQGGKSGKIGFASVEPATEAQLRAVDATVSEAVKNGTTAGAMGAGSIEYVRAQMEAAKTGASEEKPREAAPCEAPLEEAKDEAEAPQAPASDAAAQAAGEPSSPSYVPPADQPWLDPNDDELPPLDEDAPCSTPERPIDVAAAVAGVSLELEGEENSALVADGAKPLEKADAVKPEDDFRPIASSRYVAPLEPEPMEAPAEKPLATESVDAAESAEAAAPAALKAHPEEPAFAERQPSEKERAQWSAYDGKLKLANSFIGLGALKEAHELLEEVRRHGSEEQRRQAAFLEERIASRL